MTTADQVARVLAEHHYNGDHGCGWNGRCPWVGTSEGHDLHQAEVVLGLLGIDPERPMPGD